MAGDTYVPYQLKIMVIGESGVGKTSIIRRLNDDDFIDETATIGCSFRTKQVLIDGICFNLDIWVRHMSRMFALIH